MCKRFGRALMVVPALVVTALLLTACTGTGGKTDTTYEEYLVTEVTLTDGRVIECVYFGAHAGYDCNWNVEN